MKKKTLKDIRSLVYIKIGIFIGGAFLLLLIALLSIREVTYLKGTYLLGVKFDFVEGLKPTSPVRFCGVEVGEVKSVEVKKEKEQPFVIVWAKIRRDIYIPENSYFFINSLSLFGEKYLEIVPLSKPTGYLKQGQIIEGISPIALFNIFATFNKTMKEVSDFVKEGKFKTSFENVLTNLEEASKGIKELIQDIKSKEGTVGRLLYDDSLYKKTEGVVDDFEELVEDLKKHPWKLLHKPKYK